MSLRQVLFASVLVSLAPSLGISFAASARAADRSQPIPCEDIDSVGRAKMSADGTITLQLRSLWPQYEEIRHHLGGIKPGESKPVPPFCGMNSEP